MTSKVSSDMYPVSELRSEFGPRVRSTGFFNTAPNVIISFKLFSNLVPKLNNDASSLYGEIIEKALSSISFKTIYGVCNLSEVDYMFNDESNRCVAVLNDGKSLLILTCDRDARPITKSPEDFTISTSLMKEYYLENISDFSFLNQMADIIDSRLYSRAQLTNDIPNISQILADDEWIKNNIMDCLEDLRKLVSESSFVIR